MVYIYHILFHLLIFFEPRPSHTLGQSPTIELLPNLYHSFFFLSASVGGHLSYFHLVDIVKDVAMKICAEVSA
jgi:hypothetical protein